MPPKTVVQGSPTAAITEAMRQNLEKAGITDNQTLDRLIGKLTLDKVLSDLPALTQYFRLANVGYKALTEWPEDFKAVSAMPDDVVAYKAYFSGDNDTSKGVPGLDHVPSKMLRSPPQLGQWAGFTSQQTQAYTFFQTGGGKALATSPQQSSGGGYPPPPAPASGGSTGGNSGGYGGGYGGNSSSKSLGMAPGSKNQQMPGAPPGMGGGSPGTYGSDFGGGYGDNGGIAEGQYAQDVGYTPGQNYTANEQAYVQNNLQGTAGADWFGPLLMGENNFRDVSAQGVAMLDQIRGEKMRILAELQSLDNDPQSMSKV